MQTRYKTIMLDMNGYSKLLNAKKAFGRKVGRSLSFNDLILELVSKKLDFLNIDEDLKEYIAKIAGRLSALEYVYGILLFGSVAKESYNENSDIDLMLLTKNGQGYNDIMKILDRMSDDARQLSKRGLPSLVSPLVLSLDDTTHFRPFYLDFADFGITIYEREFKLTNFIYTLMGIRHSRVLLNGSEVITWQ